MHGMRAGRLRQLVTIQSCTEAQDVYGQVLKSWSTVNTVRAEVRPIEGTEVQDSGMYKGREVYQFIIRWTDLDSKNRLVYSGDNYEIISIMDRMERGRMLTVKAARVIHV